MSFDDVDQNDYTNSLNANTKNCSKSHITTKNFDNQNDFSGTHDKKETFNAFQQPSTLKKTSKSTKDKNTSLS